VERVPPAPRPFGVSADEAVELCREWMIYLGAGDTVAAQDPVRQHCDLYSSRYLAWVDNRRGNLDVDAVENAARLASSDGRQPLIFVRGGIRPVAQQGADALGVAILWYHAVDATLAGRSRLGLAVLSSGLGTA
jgi:predicted RecB family endonuclease